MDVARGPDPAALQGRIALLADRSGDVELREVLLFIERQAGELLALTGSRRNHVVVEPRDADPTPLVDQRGEHLRQGVGRIADRAAETARVQVAIGPVQQKLEVGDPTKPVGDGRLPGSELGAVADDHAVAREPLGMTGEIRFQGGAADLFLTFDEELHVQRQPALGGDPGLRSKDVR